MGCGIYAAVMPPDELGLWDGVEATSRLRHRGPDAEGAASIPLRWAEVLVAMTRLKIVDQTDLPVPFCFDHVVLAFNGEIYNWQELRAELSPREWQTRCDAEVVVAAWERWGVRCLEHFNGMFAFVLVDQRQQRVFAARDRAGEKPLYWARHGGTTYFVSEIKALPFELHAAACTELEVLDFDCAAQTPFEGVFALEPGHFMLMENFTDVSTRRWWSWNPEPVERSHHVYDELTELLIDAIKIRHVAEVPVAVQLSGGLDSAIVQAVCRSERLYCVTFPDDGVDNLTAARTAAQGREVTSVSFTRDEMLAELDGIAYHLDTPATWTAACQWFMNRRIAADGAVVVLSGEGADELFGGYSRYRVLWWLDRMRRDQRLAGYDFVINRAVGDTRDVLARQLNRGGDDVMDYAYHLVDTHDATHPICAARRLDFYTTMQVLLRMADRMAAAFSLENRSPFFDYRVMELAAKLPPTMLVTPDASKEILRVVARRLGVPSAIVDEHTKKGLFVPQSWGEGSWDREWFARLMQEAWQRRFFG